MILSDKNVSIHEILAVALQRKKIRLSTSKVWQKKIKRGRELLLEAAGTGHIVYGMNTGVGNASKNLLCKDAVNELQIHLIAQHGCGVGPDLNEEEARAVCLIRLISLCKGYSGVRMALLKAMEAFLNSGLVPAIPTFGSVGASGDLTPLSYFGAVLCGHRFVYLNGKKMPARKALTQKNLQALTLESKEAIAIINGTAVMTALGILNLWRARNLLDLAIQASALATEVLLGNSLAFDAVIHNQKPFPGQIRAAEKIMKHLTGSRLVHWSDETLITRTVKADRTVQDRYSIRCAPHILGASWDALTWIETVLQTELNSVSDNPMIDAATGKVYMGGNFYGGHVTLAMDLMKIALANTADLIDRQVALLVDEANNRGLPENLLPPLKVDDPHYGLYHGLKGLQITLSALTALAIQKTQPDSTLSRPTEAGNQDKVSMGTNAAINARQVIDLAEKCLAIEMIALSQAAYIRGGENISPSGRQLLEQIRQHVPVITRDRPLDQDLENLFGWIRSQALQHIDQI